MNTLTIATEQDVEDLAWGACFQGIGGGGNVSEGVRLLKKAIAEHGPIACINPQNFPDEAYVVTTSFMGNRAPLSPAQEAQKKSLGLVEWKYENNLVEALQLMEKISGKKISGIVPSELGGANTPGPLATALSLGIMVLDGDYTGKAKPETKQGTPSIGGVSLTPMTSVDKWGNKAVIYETVNNALAEREGKMLAQAAFGNTAMAFFLLPGREMKKYIFSGTLSECLSIGQCMRSTREAGKDVREALLHFTNAKMLFEGNVVKKEWGVPDGYYTGLHWLEGTGAYIGHTFRVWFKNENHISWFDEKPFVTTPDRIAQIVTKTGVPIMTQEVEEGMNISFMALASRPRHREPDALPFMEPRHYDFDMDYVPLEKILK